MSSMGTSKSKRKELYTLFKEGSIQLLLMGGRACLGVIGYLLILELCFSVLEWCFLWCLIDCLVCILLKHWLLVYFV